MIQKNAVLEPVIDDDWVRHDRAMAMLVEKVISNYFRALMLACFRCYIYVDMYEHLTLRT